MSNLKEVGKNFVKAIIVITVVKAAIIGACAISNEMFK